MVRDEVPRLDAATCSTARRDTGGTGAVRREPVDDWVGVAAGELTLRGHLVSPAWPRGLVVLPRATPGEPDVLSHRCLLARLRAADVATFEVDVLTVAERPWQENLGDVALLTLRLRAAVASVRGDHPWVACVGTRATAGAVLHVAAGGGVAAVVLLGAGASLTEPARPASGTLPPILSLPDDLAASAADAVDRRMDYVTSWLVHRGSGAASARGATP